ncbi:MAG TPA: hypothetical protein VKX41_15835 [Alloacidobacterium sp.]|nr:hypothetical protein [Alloacidobacterium sp.]
MIPPGEMTQRRLALRQEIQSRLPDFASACEGDIGVMLIHQDAFAADLQEEEFALLGRAIKYAGFFGKEVRIIANP